MLGRSVEMSIDDYKFVAKTSNWRNSAGVIEERSVALDIRRYDEEAEQNIKGVWEKMKQAVSNHHKQFDEMARMPMSERRFVDFEPAWLRTKSTGLDFLAESPALGLIPPSSPKLPTRIVPRNGGNSISALTLVDTVAATQRILNFASYEAIYGIHLDFSDLRSLEAHVLDLAKLHVEPFDDGSFIIPAGLGEDGYGISVEGVNKEFYPSDVLARFVDLMEGVARDGARFQACIGAVQAIEELGKVIRREANTIEFYPVGFKGNWQNSKRISVDQAYVDVVSAAKKLRQDPRTQADNVEGILTAVDLLRGTFKVRLQKRQSVSGTYTQFMEDRMIRSLGRRVRLFGNAEYRDQRIRSLRAIDIELSDGAEAQ